MSCTAASLGIAPRAKTRARGTSPRAATNPAPSPGSKRRRVSLPDERPDLEVPKRLTNRPSAAAEESDAIAMDAANIPVVSASEFHARLAAAAHPKALDAYAAFYSSWYAPARATRPRSTPARTALPRPSPFAHAPPLSIPSPPPQDRLHNHGSLGDGTPDGRPHGPPRPRRFRHRARPSRHVHMLERHLERFARSMASAKISPPMSLDAMRAVILRTVAASGLRDAQVRYYASAGPGGFALSAAECVRSAFYCVVVKNREGPDPTVGVSVVTSDVPIKPPAFATVKSVNYLPNALVVAEAAERGADYGVWRTGTRRRRRGTVHERRLRDPGRNVRHAAVRRGVGGMYHRARVRTGAFRSGGAPRRDAGGNSRGFVRRGEAREGGDARRVGHRLRARRAVGRAGRGRRREGPAAVVAGKPGPVGLALHAAIRADFETNDEEKTRVPYETFEGDGAR